MWILGVLLPCKVDSFGFDWFGFDRLSLDTDAGFGLNSVYLHDSVILRSSFLISTPPSQPSRPSPCTKSKATCSCCSFSVCACICMNETLIAVVSFTPQRLLHPGIFKTMPCIGCIGNCESKSHRSPFQGVPSLEPQASVTPELIQASQSECKHGFDRTAIKLPVDRPSWDWVLGFPRKLGFATRRGDCRGTLYSRPSVPCFNV